MRKTLLGLLVGVTGTVCGYSTAHADADDPNLHLIEARKGEMEVRAFSAAPLFDMAKGKIAYDAEQAAKLANNLKVLTQLDMGGAWAPDTGKDKYPVQLCKFVQPCPSQLKIR